MPVPAPLSEETRIYECAVLYPPALSPTEEQGVAKEVEGIFDDVQAKVVAKDIWGRRGLAYAIGGFREGKYVVYYYEMHPAKVQEVDQALRILKGVLRHMFVKLPKGYEIIRFSEKYQQWMKERQEEQEGKAHAEEERLRRQVVEKAKQEVKKSEERAIPSTSGISEKELSAQIEKVISTEDINL